VAGRPLPTLIKVKNKNEVTMKKILCAVIAVCAVCAHAALDTSLTYHDQVLAAQAPTLEQTVVTLLAPQTMDPGGNVIGTTNDVSVYAGKSIIACSVSTGSVTVALGYAAATLTATSYTFTSSATIQSEEIDLDTIQGTNAAIYIRASCTNTSEDTSNAVSVALVPLTARAALQTITGSAVDTVNYKGNGTIVVSIGAPVNGATNFSGLVTIQAAANSTGTYAAVTNCTATATGNAAGAVTEIPYEFGKGGRYIRAVYTTTNDVAPVAVTLNAFR